MGEIVYCMGTEVFEMEDSESIGAGCSSFCRLRWRRRRRRWKKGEKLGLCLCSFRSFLKSFVGVWVAFVDEVGGELLIETSGDC